MTRARRLAGATGILLLLVLVAVLGRALFQGGSSGTGSGVTVDEGAGVGLQAVTLYFADPEGADLATERRDLLVGSGVPALVTAALEALARGPEGRLARIVPQGTRVHHVFMDREGVVYADFTRELRTGMVDAGLSQEVLLLRSLARTLSVNFRGLKSLMILVDGKVVPSLGGRIDTSRPLPLAEWQ